MDTLQIIVKTVVTTLDVIIILSAIKDGESSMQKAALIFIAINCVGVWI